MHAEDASSSEECNVLKFETKKFDGPARKVQPPLACLLLVRVVFSASACVRFFFRRRFVWTIMMRFICGRLSFDLRSAIEERSIGSDLVDGSSGMKGFGGNSSVDVW